MTVLDTGISIACTTIAQSSFITATHSGMHAPLTRPVSTLCRMHLTRTDMY